MNYLRARIQHTVCSHAAVHLGSIVMQHPFLTSLTRRPCWSRRTPLSLNIRSTTDTRCVERTKSSDIAGQTCCTDVSVPVRSISYQRRDCFGIGYIRLDSLYHIVSSFLTAVTGVSGKLSCRRHKRTHVSSLLHGMSSSLKDTR